MNAEEHKAAVKESIEVIKEAIQTGIERRQRTIGFHCSAAVIDLLELFLHKNNIIDPGKTMKHDFFSSERKALSKLSEDFPEKQKIIALLVSLETKRNQLCYGKLKQKEDVEAYLALFARIRSFFDEKVQYDT